MGTAAWDTQATGVEGRSRFVGKASLSGLARDWGSSTAAGGRQAQHRGWQGPSTRVFKCWGSSWVQSLSKQGF